MSYVIDTNLLITLMQPSNSERTQITHAISRIHQRGDHVYTLPQNIIELWNWLTRPSDVHPPGLGLTIEQADVEMREIERMFPVQRETQVIFDEWRRLVVAYRVSGKQVYDARIAAVMRMIGLEFILTFNSNDFRRYPGITAVHPKDV